MSVIKIDVKIFKMNNSQNTKRKMKKKEMKEIIELIIVEYESNTDLFYRTCINKKATRIVEKLKELIK